MSYQLFTDATSDLCPAMTEGLPCVQVIPMEGELESLNAAVAAALLMYQSRFEKK